MLLTSYGMMIAMNSPTWSFATLFNTPFTLSSYNIASSSTMYTNSSRMPWSPEKMKRVQ